MTKTFNESSPKAVLNQISNLREQRGKENDTLMLIKKAQKSGHDFIVNLFWEEALTYQHLLMNEDSKGDSKDNDVRMKNLLNMKDVIGKAKYYIVRLDLNKWKSRLYRFMGRLEDYEGNYSKAVGNYKKSIKFIRLDPEFVEDKFPRYLEIEGFLSFSLIMSGKVDVGYRLATDVYEKFETDEFAIRLRRKNYQTWAIWRSGIVTRTINALIFMKSSIGSADINDWLGETERLLTPRKSFSYRLHEIETLKEKLSGV